MESNQHQPVIRQQLLRLLFSFSSSVVAILVFSHTTLFMHFELYFLLFSYTVSLLVYSVKFSPLFLKIFLGGSTIVARLRAYFAQRSLLSIHEGQYKWHWGLQSGGHLQSLMPYTIASSLCYLWNSISHTSQAKAGSCI